LTNHIDASQIELLGFFEFVQGIIALVIMGTFGVREQKRIHALTLAATHSDKFV
jgi:hypothetical protein